jgi:hypothetical protein
MITFPTISGEAEEAQRIPAPSLVRALFSMIRLLTIEGEEEPVQKMPPPPTKVAPLLEMILFEIVGRPLSQ